MTMELSRRHFVGGVVTACGTAAATSEIARSAEPDGGKWLNEPRKWSRKNGAVSITANPKTDFWRKTFYGYITDNGHMLYRPVSGDFISTVRVSGDYAALYDQAGLMVRFDESTWMKCGVEFVGARQTISTVFTRDYSDWSTIPLLDAPKFLWMRVARKGGALTISYSRDGKTFDEVRQGWLTPAHTVDVGLMCAAPEGPGFEARFDGWVTTASP
jgi:regulation of enolase protein 1 (concanavalin A-like superfamily)